MFRRILPLIALTFASLTVACLLGSACTPLASPGDNSDQVLDSNPGTGGNDTGGSTDTDDGGTTTPGVLQVKIYTESLGAQSRTAPSGQQAPDDVDVKLTPVGYSIAFKRIVLKNVNTATQTVSNEVEIFNANNVADAKIVDLANTSVADLLNIATLPAGTYNKVDIEVFYLDMTLPTIYPGSTSYDIKYRMAFEDMGVIQQRDMLLWLKPEYATGFNTLASLVTAPGWYWMERPTSQGWDHVVPVDGAATHPQFTVFDLFSNDAFWGSEHKILEGGWIDPPLNYDPTAGAVVTINCDVTDCFDFKDYHDDTIQPDGKWEIRRDAGTHPFTPNFQCTVEGQEQPDKDGSSK